MARACAGSSAFSLALACTGGGAPLLIDEIDTGLHYSIMGDLWEMVVEMARRNNVQVFATTHSLDCVRGLAWLCEHHPDLGDDVSLQTIDPDLEESVASDARGIRIAVEQDIEVRSMPVVRPRLFKRRGSQRPAHARQPRQGPRD